MFGKIAGFEFRYQMRQPIFWVAVIVFGLFAFGGIASENISISGGGAVHKNAPYDLARWMGAWSLFFMFITTGFVANVVVRDDDTGFGPIVRATGVRKTDYLMGRFAGAFAAAAIAFLAVPLGQVLGTLMPWMDQDLLGPNRLGDYAWAYFVIALPNLFLTSALLFAVSTVTKSMMSSYVGVIVLLVVYTVATSALERQPEFELALAYGDPFGGAAFDYVTKYWTISDRNTLVPPMTGPLFFNRLIWITVACAALAAAHELFRPGAKGARLSKKDKLKVLADKTANGRVGGPLPQPRFDGRTARTQMFARTKFEIGQVLRSPAYVIILCVGLFFALVTLWFTGQLYGTEIWPVTRVAITALNGAFTLVSIVMAIFWAGELVWRERDRKMHEIVDSTAAPDWAFVFPKTVAIAFVLLSTLAISVVAGVIVQTLKGYTNFEFDKYFLWYVLPGVVDFTLLAVLAVFVQALSPHKFVGWGIMLIYLISTIVLANLGFENNLYHYGNGPGVPLSDMNGQGRFWEGAWWFRAYWTAFAVLLLLVSYSLWRRGTETRLMPRLRRLPRRLRGGTGAVALVSLLAFVGLGGWIFVNTGVWNDYKTRKGEEQRLVDFEKALAPSDKKTGQLLHPLPPQPSVVSVKLDLDLHPRAPSLRTRGEYVLENRTGKPLDAVHLRMDEDLKVLKIDLPGAVLQKSYPEFNYRIYRLATPMAPGERRTLKFETLIEQKGFKNRGGLSRVAGNGTFIDNSSFAPMLGMSRSGLLTDPSKRKKHGLAAELHIPKLEDDSARARNYLDNADWVTADITVTTDADQTPIAPGYKVRDEVKGGRRTAEFRTEAPVLHFFSVQSARYAEKHETYKGVDIAVYYDPQHPWNVDRMIKAAKAGLDYYQAAFGPYQFRQIRFIEFPAYASFAQAFANTVPWSEGLGFIARLEDPEKIDYVTYVGAHELGHQWWAHQVIGAEMQGETVLSETLAQYSALMVMERMYGPDKIRKFLKYELDSYLRARSGERLEELPLVKNENQQYIHYRKGSLVMYLLKDQIGEEAVNRALRKILAQYAFKGAPYPSSKDLVAALRAEAPADKQGLITDLFEKITLYDIKAQSLTVKKRKDGKYDVALTVNARKLYADGKGKETPAAIAPEDSFDVGLFTAKPGKKEFSEKSVILFQRTPLKSGVQTLRFVTDQAPKFGGADPYNKRIDRDSDDNLATATAG
jgi:aminopeptidase N